MNLDVSLQKKFRIRESNNIEFRTELFNSLNHPNLFNPVTTFNSSSFGTITTAATAREIQFGIRYGF